MHFRHKKRGSAHSPDSAALVWTPFRHPGYFGLAFVLAVGLPQIMSDRPVARGESEARATVESTYAQWLELIKEKEALGDEVFSARVDSLIEGLFDLEWLGSHVLSVQWDTLAPAQRTRFIGALRASIRKKTLSPLAEDDGLDPPSFTSTLDDVDDGRATLKYVVKLRSKEAPLTLRMLKEPGGSWRITDVESAAGSLAASYQRRAAAILRRYSFPYLVAVIGDYPYVVLEDFESSPVGKLPPHWAWRARDNDKHKPYAVREEDGNKYLEARDEGESVILAKDMKWDLTKYPYGSFRWRVHKIPAGADERSDDKVDSGAAVYFVYRKKLGLIPESVKFIWSTSLPVGSALQRKGTGKPWMVVIESGKERLGEWHTYVFDLREAYRKTFGHEPPKRALGIALLSDANSTKSHAWADYDDFRALRTVKGPVTSGVVRILEAN